jgi:formate hydrogenlyase subunit 3/multisubunit Na+/H+ antiporter MnhD subunit
MNEWLEFMMQPLVHPVAIALVGGALAYLLSRLVPRVCGAVSLLTAAGVLLCGARLMSAPPEAVSWSWASLGEDLDFVVELAPSRLGLFVLTASSAFVLLVGVYALRAMAGNHWEGKFHAYATWALAGAALVALAGNLFILLIGWELVTLMLFLMICQGKGEARAGAAKAYGVLGFADACLLLAVVMLIAQPGGTSNLSLTRGPVSVGDMGAAGYVIYALILVAALAKAGAIPLHTWIPSVAEDAPTPVMALLPAALDKLLGIYLLAVLCLRFFRPDGAMQLVLMAVGAVTILSAVLMAMVQHNLKKLLSFHAVSQVGYMVLGIGTGTTIGVIGGLFHMVNHAIYKSNLFLMSGVVGEASGSDEIEDMGGLARHLPVTLVCGTVSAAAISGVPPFNGFVSKWLVYQGALAVGGGRSPVLASALVTVAVFGSALTLASFVKVIYSAFLSPAPKGRRVSKVPPRESFLLAGPMVVLALACVVLGLWPGLITDTILVPSIPTGATWGPGVTDAGTGAIGTPTGHWEPARATMLLLIGMLLGTGLLWLSSRRVRVVRPFLCGEVPAATDDRFRVPATHFYETVQKLPWVGPMLAHGQLGAMDLYYWCGKHGHVVVDVLRAQHTGLISLYAAWCVIGFVVTLGYILLSSL